ncbi:MAG TPA: multidrug effflux MFS transporter [Bauldia sp.]|nr:multidrug effflux MFS transporter [Bauldia sp.]
MRLKPDTPAFVLLLAFLTMIGPLSTDIFLPSMPAMAVIFHTTPAAIQATLTAYFIGFALAQLAHGPISDRIGRRPVLIAGLAAYTIASFLCIVAPSVELLVAGRFVQSVAAAGPIILARTIVRDIHSGVRAGQLLSVMASIMGLIPILAPVAGGFLEANFGWQSTFWVMTLAGVAGFGIVAIALPETIRERRTEPLSILSIAQSYAVVARSRIFLAYAALICFAYSGLIIYVGTSAFIVQGRYGLSAVAYGLAFACGAVAFVGGTVLGRRIAKHGTLSRAVGFGVAFLAAGGVLLPLCVALGPLHVASFVVPMAVYMIGIGIVIPQSLAAALTPFPERAGAASSLLGFLHMGSGAIVLWAAGTFFGADPLANVCVLGVSGVTAALVYLATMRVRAA